jgi:DNA-binding NtrC family response regulator
MIKLDTRIISDTVYLNHQRAKQINTNPGKQRLIIYQHDKEAVIPVRELELAGWGVSVARNGESVRSIIGESHIRVGLALFGKIDSDNTLDEIATVLGASAAIFWIALINHECTHRNAVCELIAKSCYDYHTLPIDPVKLLTTLGHADGMARMNEIHSLRNGDTAGMGDLIGNSPPMRDLFKAIRKVAEADAPVLLVGESGTGKELTARTIHNLSNRSKEPFVAVNCAALPATLIQSELFGHEKGAFTGANQRRIGRFEAAHGGTIFLDEISDLPRELQINLLRFLQESVIERLGSTDEIKVNARVIAATQDNLEVAVRHGGFRGDLYYRLNVLPIKTPSLRERGTDIELLARRVLSQVSAQNGNRRKEFSQQSLQAMLRHPWPGNVRELINRVRRAVVMAEGRLITPVDLGLEEFSLWKPATSLQSSRREAAKKAIESALSQTRNNISQTARNLGVSRTTVYRMMTKYGILAD